MATTTNLGPERGWAIVTSTPGDRARSFLRARRHTRLVRSLRWTLPTVALVVCGLYVGSILKTIGWVEGLPQIEISKIIPENLTMHNPRYEGFNDDGGTYVVTAKTAVQDLTDLSRITLNGIVGDLVDANKSKTTLNATHGYYNSKSNELELYDGIDIVSESGLKARLTRANVLTKQNLVVSKEPVTVEMPGGTIRSNEMTLHNKTRKVTFLNAVVAHLVPSEPPKAATAAAASAAPMISATNGPIDITADKLEIDDAQKSAVFSGNVRAVQGDAVLETVALEVRYDSSNTGLAGANPNGAKIRSIAAPSPVVMTRAPSDRVTGNRLDFDALKEVAVLTGDVIMTSGTDRRATADTVSIDQKANTILLAGNVAALQGRNELSGGRLYVEQATGRTQLSNPAADGQQPGRISTRFYQDANASQKPAAAGAAASAGTTAVSMFKTDPNAPVDVEADRLDVDDRAKVAVFKGGVRAAQGDFVVRTAELSARYVGAAGLAEQANAAAAAKEPARLTRIEARGKVIVTSKSGQNATGDWADFDVKANQVTLGGDVVLTQDKNVVRGTRLVIDMATGQAVIHDDPGAAWTAKAAPEGEDKKGYVVQGPNAGRRPSAIFYPMEKKPGSQNSQKASPAPEVKAPETSGSAWSVEGESR
jgi:lipopolysaccharide transport protein LptA/LPS export ABC transporter protein LptC